MYVLPIRTVPAYSHVGKHYTYVVPSLHAHGGVLQRVAASISHPALATAA